MKLNLRRSFFAALGALSAGVALAAAPLGASAFSPTPPPTPPVGTSFDVIAFSGHTTALNPAVPLTGVVAVGAGSFSFQSDACAGVSTADDTAAENPPGGPDDPTKEAGLCNFSVASGSYAQLAAEDPQGVGACGFGHADGTANIATSEGPFTVVFHIGFNAGVGIITGTSTDADSDSATTHPVYGVVQITPTGTAAPNTCATGFTATGVAYIVS